MATSALKQKIDPSNVYIKNGDNWEIELQEKEPYLFDSNKIRLDTFTYKVDNNEEEKVIINLTEQENAEREIFTIFTRYLTNVPVKGLIVKAELETESSDVTPLISEYLLKIR